jgi:hypothetical protein
VLVSTNASAVKTYTPDSITRTSFGDRFLILRGQERVTWVYIGFSRMGRREVFDLALRADEWAPSTGWTQFLTIRQLHSGLGRGCSGGGNAENLLLRIWLRPRRDHWMLDVRGGESPQRDVQTLKRFDLGPVVVGEPLALRVDVYFHHVDGHLSLWRNGSKVADVATPIGFHYLCDGVTDISRYPIRVQHGIYRDPNNPTLVLSSSGLRFVGGSHQPP